MLVLLLMIDLNVGQSVQPSARRKGKVVKDKMGKETSSGWEMQLCNAWRLAINVPELWTYFFRVSSLAYPNLLGKKGYVVVVVVLIVVAVLVACSILLKGECYTWCLIKFYLENQVNLSPEVSSLSLCFACPYVSSYEMEASHLSVWLFHIVTMSKAWSVYLSLLW